MSRKRKHVNTIIENLEIISAGAEGKAIARHNERVVFVEGAVPGDIVDAKVTKQKSKFFEAKTIAIHKKGASRIEPFCSHFGICGGCKWQHMDYAEQLKWKEQQVKDSFTRIGKLEWKEFRSILGSAATTYYRNKLEFTFSNQQWLTEEQLKDPEINMHVPTLGFHAPGRFDKVLQINHCYLQPEPSNQIRNFIQQRSIELGLLFYNLREKTGDVRNLMLRNTLSGEWMVLLIFGSELNDAHKKLLGAVKQEFSQIKSLLYTVNTKLNDTIYDLDIHTFAGSNEIIETLDGLKYKISAKSFFQTNPAQTLNLYKTAIELAGLTGKENVYDLYTGTGTIALFAARHAKKVVGIESVPQAIEDAKMNAETNGISNASFFAGDMKDMLTEDFIKTHGQPDVIITDPPRAGMHPSVVEILKRAGAQTIVYVSCNPATQARDLELLKDTYTLDVVQPVDMFPHTHHVECVVRLRKI
ncbi:MAG: 23S rRNA (uracil(1939)-C(5))-methyltransferase RlmD [Flavobacteriales bacterium]